MLLTGLLVWSPLILSIAAQVTTILSFDSSDGGVLIADATSSPRIAVADSDWYGVQRAAQDLAQDFGKVTGLNGSVSILNGTSAADFSILAGTIGRSSTIDALVSSGQLDVSRIEGKWEAYQIQMLNLNGTESLVVAGADKRGTIYGIYQLSEQLGISPWHWFADVATTQQDKVYAVNISHYASSPSVKYRGLFINDEQPGLTNWIRENYPDVEYGAGFTRIFYSNVFELLLRLKANYFWPAMWGSMFYVDDPENAKTADDYGIVMGTSHTEPLARATNEQSNFMNGTWSWAYNKDNVTEFMRQGAERARPYETLYTLGMRGLGDVASPTLNGSSLEEIVQTQQNILREVYNTSDLSGIPQMWCLYKEVGEYYADGLDVPDDVTLLWAEDNWGSAQRLPLVNETSRSGGAGLYYHVDYVGDPRNYKWINSINLQKSWYELQQAYARGAQTIWVLNVGDLKNLELPIHHFMDIAYDVELWSHPTSTLDWLTQWSGRSFSPELAPQIAEVLSNYSTLAGRRKYELLSAGTYSTIEEEEAETVLEEWSQLSTTAQNLHSSLSLDKQPSFFELVLHPIMAGSLMHQIHISVGQNNLYATQGRTSTNTLAAKILQLFDDDYSLTQQYHSLLNGKWDGILDQTHIGYQYWQQPVRNSLPPISYVQSRQLSLAGPLGVTCEGTNASVPGDDRWHALSSNAISLPPMDPSGPPTRWIEVFSRGTGMVAFNVTANDSAVTITPSSGVLNMNGSDLDRRLYVSVDWSQVGSSMSTALINITTSTVTETRDINSTKHLYGSYGMPQVMVSLNKTSPIEDLPVGSFIESNGRVAMEAAHFTNITNGSDPHLRVVPGLSRTLVGAGLALGPFVLNDTLEVADDTPHVTYSFCSFVANKSENANLTLYFAPGLNTNGDRPLRYAVRIRPLSGEAMNDTQIVQPVPYTKLGVLPALWTGMVSNAVLESTTSWNVTELTVGDQSGIYTLDVWLMEPGLVLQKMVFDFDQAMSNTYLGPRESYRWSGN